MVVVTPQTQLVWSCNILVPLGTILQQLMQEPRVLRVFLTSLNQLRTDLEQAQ
jgi:hypothetical protein